MRQIRTPLGIRQICTLAYDIATARINDKELWSNILDCCAKLDSKKLNLLDKK